MQYGQQHYQPTLNTQLRKAGTIPMMTFKVRGLWKVDYRYKPNDWERDLSYSMLYAQTIWQGCCYVDYGKVKIDESILGQDGREIAKSDIDISTKIAVFNTVFAVFEKKPSATYYIDGSASEKTIRGQVL